MAVIGTVTEYSSEVLHSSILAFAPREIVFFGTYTVTFTVWSSSVSVERTVMSSHVRSPAFNVTVSPVSTYMASSLLTCVVKRSPPEVSASRKAAVSIVFSPTVSCTLLTTPLICAFTFPPDAFTFCNVASCCCFCAIVTALIFALLSFASVSAASASARFASLFCCFCCFCAVFTAFFAFSAAEVSCGSSSSPCTNACKVHWDSFHFCLVSLTSLSFLPTTFS